MGFFSKLFGQQAKPSSPTTVATAPPAADSSTLTPDQLALAGARTALSLDDFSAALVAATPLMQATDKSIRQDAIQICSLAAIASEQWPDAYSVTQKLFELAPTAHHALQLAVAAIMIGDAKRGDAWISKAIEINERRKVLPPMLIRTQFIRALVQQQQLAPALPHLDWMKGVYLPLHNTDPTYLALRGLPDFDAFLAQSWPVVIPVLASSQAIVWYSEMLPYLDTPGQSAVRAVLRTQLGFDS
ncbi:hypothetical protein [Chitinimonas sp. BJB300]|uniref:hypothetical protein n=1 Tax=Chitinimonas sp. BJB300 TaxID=1559339 RepID=UPI000C0D8F98|nr:hypothetical protein [Chitinimonas sp. BJB300]PHV12899.1 hypothetical protein CSQ89_03150 [Chitinimonas sp. BJB300]TSJ88468.1 hypothetical protein FG002_009820 [Chitinimonas sp. BJB300]